MTTIMEKLGKSVEKVLGTKSNIKKIVEDIKADKAFMKKYENAKTDETKRQLLEEKVSQIIEKEFEDVKGKQIKKAKDALKTIIVFPTSRRIKERMDNYELLPSDIKSQVGKYVKRIEKGVRHPGFNLLLEIKNPSFKLVGDAGISIFVAPYWKTTIIELLSRAIKSQDENSKLKNARSYRGKTGFEIADKIINEWLGIDKKKLEGLYNENLNLNLLRYVIAEKFGEKLSADVKKRLNAIKEEKNHPAVIVSKFNIEKLKDNNEVKKLKAKYNNTYYKGVYYYKQAKEFIINETVEDSVKPTYVKEMIKNAIKFLLALEVEYNTVKGKKIRRKLLSIVDLSDILKDVVKSLEGTTILTSPIEVDEIIEEVKNDIDTLIKKTTLKQYKNKNIEDLIKERNNILDINDEDKEKNKIEVKKNDKDGDKSYLKYKGYKFRVFWGVDGNKRYLIMDINKDGKTEKIEITPSMIGLSKVFKEYLDKVVNGEEEITLGFIILLIKNIVNGEVIQSSVNNIKTESGVDEKEEKTQKVSKEEVSKTKKTQQKDIEEKTNILAGMGKSKAKVKK